MVGLAEEPIKLPFVLPFLSALVFFGQIVPRRQLFESLAEELIIFVVGTPGIASLRDPVLQIFLELIKAEYLGVDETSVEDPLHQDLQFGEPEQGDRAFPGPDVAFALRSQLGIAKKAGGRAAVEFAPQGNHSERLEHASANEFIGIWIEDDVVKRLRITIENRGHDSVAGRGYRISEDLFGLRAPQQTRERSVGGPFSPFSEQMKDEK